MILNSKLNYPSTANHCSNLPPLSAVQAGTAFNAASHDQLVNAAQSISLWITECALEQMLDPWSQTPVPTIHDHCEVFCDNGWLYTVLQLKKGQKAYTLGTVRF